MIRQGEDSANGINFNQIQKAFCQGSIIDELYNNDPEMELIFLKEEPEKNEDN